MDTETLDYMFANNMARVPTTDFLRTVQSGDITPASRQQLAAWMLEVSVPLLDGFVLLEP